MKPKNSKQGLEAALRVLHNFDIPLGTVVEPGTKEIEIVEYTVAYSINDYKVKYAPYGYIQKSAKNKNRVWFPTSNPVELCKKKNVNNKKYIIPLLILSGIAFRNFS